MIIIIQKIFRAPIYHTKWEHRALYNNTNDRHRQTDRHPPTHPPPPHTHIHTLEHTLARAHARAYTHTHTHTHTLKQHSRCAYLAVFLAPRT